MANTITLNYTPSGGALTATAIPVLIEKGLTHAEKFAMWPPIINKALDGSCETQYRSFIRSLVLKTNALTDAQLIAYLNWCLDNSRTIDYSIDGISETGIVLIPEAEQELSRFNDCRLTPYLEITMAEGTARTAWVR